MTEKPQLKMAWPTDRLDQPPHVETADRYRRRIGDRDDEVSFLALMRRCGWDFDRQRLDYCYSRLLPAGWFVVVDASENLVASAMAFHNYSGLSTYSGTLGWVGCDPDHRGRKLGSVVAAAVTTKLLQAGYADIELYTEHYRQPAIASYLAMGYVPYLYNDAVTQLWHHVCDCLGHPFTPDKWPSGTNAFPTTG